MILDKSLLKALLYSIVISQQKDKWFWMEFQFPDKQQIRFSTLQFFNCLIGNIRPHSNLGQFIAHDSIQSCMQYQNNTQILSQAKLQPQVDWLLPYQHLSVHFNQLYQVFIITTCLSQNPKFVQKLNKIQQFYYAGSDSATKIFQKLIPLNQIEQLRDIASQYLASERPIKKFYCRTFQKISHSKTIATVDSLSKLKLLLKNIIDQFLILHDEKYSLCCPIQFSMVINPETLQVNFFYVGHPDYLVGFIYENIKNQTLELIQEYYPIQQILDYQKNPIKFTKIDVWMLAKSLLRIVQALSSKEILQSRYLQHLKELIKLMMRPLGKRLKMNHIKQKLSYLAQKF